MVEEKEKREPKLICELTGSIGWVSFTPFQLDQIGINPDKHTTKDLREKVFSKLGIEARPKKAEEPKKEKKKENAGKSK